MQDPLRQVRRVPRLDRDLEPVLAGVARAGDHDVLPDRPGRAHVHEAHARDVRRDRGEHRLGLRPLQRQERPVERLEHAIVADRRLEVREIGLLAGGVHHQQQVVRAVGHHQVVEDPAGVVGQEPVALPPRLQPDDVDRHQPLQRPLPRPPGFPAAAGPRSAPCG